MTQSTTGLEIAVIGISGRFPQSKDIETFWQNLINGKELTSKFPETKTTAGGILEDVDLFDASFFGFNPREAEAMDPQHRLFLEYAWAALENAGYDSERESRPIGVYAGVGISTYLLYNLSPNQEFIKSRGFIPTLVGVDKDYLPTRVSYKLNLTGPSISVGTACSSSLVAVHLACQSLLSGECDMTLAAGVAIKVPQDESTLSPGVIVSADGHCRAFAKDANGTIGGNGLGVVVLKRLEDAIADRDYIYGVIKGSAINNDGAEKVGYTAPSQEGQARVIRAAQIMAEVEPETISYIEAHGTGTTLGDPIEIAALTQAFRTSTDKKGYCAIGSVKTNVGHLDAAAGITGFIKTILALDRQLLPPSLNFDAPNPEIDFDNSPFYVNTELNEWKTNKKPRRAAVSSFGFGGTNAHVILEEAPLNQLTVTSDQLPVRKHHLLVISAKTSSALEIATGNLVNYLKQNLEANLADVAYTLQVGRRVFNHRRTVIVENVEDAITALTSPQRVLTQCQETKDRSVVFMFTGQGSQYVNMARSLYESKQVFRQECDRCFQILQPYLKLDLPEIIYPASPTSLINETQYTQPAIFVIEYALAKLWMSWGIKPVAMIGHSIGEYVAATLAGVFSLEDALALVTARGQLMQQLPSGSMLAIPLSEAEILPLLNVNLSLAVVNGISNCVVSGTNEAIETLQNKLTTQGIDCRRLHTSHAFHSPMMEPMLESFLAQVKQVNLNPPQIPYISNVTGTWITTEEATNPAYWTTHLRQTVRFESGLQELFKQPDYILLEVGAGRTLSKLAKQHPEKQPSQLVFTSVRHPKEAQSDVKFILNTVGQLWLSGVEIDWSGFYQQEKRNRLPLPTYPFERQRYWIEPPQGGLGDEGTRRRGDKEKDDFSETSSKLWNSLVEVGIQASQALEEKNSQTYLDNQQLLERLSMAYMNLALRQNGAFGSLEDKYTRLDLSQQCQVISRYQPLLNRWLQVLIEKGQLEQEGDKFTNLVPCSIDSVQDLLGQARVNQVESPKILDLVQQCGENLAGVITGKQQPLEFFKGLLYEFNEEENDNLESLSHGRYSSIIRSILGQVRSSLSTQGNLRVLEIASGVSQATEELIPVLSSSETSYTFADVSASFVPTAQQKFSKYPFIECRALDLDRPFSEQKYSPGSFDVIVAVKSLHTAKNIETTLDNVHFLLAPGGVLLLWEKTQATLDFDLTWALLIEPSGDSLDSPYLSEKQWQKALHDSGFVEVAALPETTALGEHVLLAQVATKPQNTRTVSQVAAGKKSDLADWFYVPSWKRSILPQPVGNRIGLTKSDSWLVFVDQEGLGWQILKELGLEEQNVIVIQIGNNFSYQGKSDQGQRIYTINPQNSSDYDALIEELLDLNWTPSKVLHLWSVNEHHQAPSGLAEVDRIQSTGFYSLLFLVQAIFKSNLTDGFYQGDVKQEYRAKTQRRRGETRDSFGLEIAVISNNLQSVTGEEVITPEKATILGAIKTIPLEYPNISCRCIDVLLPNVSEEKLVEQLLTELSLTSSDQVIAYRGKHRWIQSFEPVRLESKAGNIPQMRSGGVYLITGGLGGVGLVMAEHLAKAVQAKLILCGRSEFPKRSQWSEWLASHDESNSVSVKIRQIKALEALGAEVLVASADVSDRNSMESLVNQAQERFGKINGIIHAAGVAIPGEIASRSLETVESVLEPKVKGVLVLEEIFQDTLLDFFVLFSSLSSLSGGYALDYVAANAFLDAYAHYRSVNDQSFTVAINWDNWQQVGMAVQEEVSAELKPFYLENQKNSITTAEGIDAFNRILSYSLPQVVVTGRDLENAIAQHHSAKAIAREAEVIPSGQLYPRPNLGNAYVSPRNSIEQTLTDLWQQLLGIEQVGIYDNFFELGGDSILSFQVALKAKQGGLQLQPNHLFEHPTIADLATVAETLQPKEETKETAHIDSSQSSNGYTANLSQTELNKLLTKIDSQKSSLN